MMQKKVVGLSLILTVVLMCGVSSADDDQRRALAQGYEQLVADADDEDYYFPDDAYSEEEWLSEEDFQDDEDLDADYGDGDLIDDDRDMI